MAQRNALGRGLGALIDDAGQEHEVTADAVNEIDIDRREGLNAWFMRFEQRLRDKIAYFNNNKNQISWNQLQKNQKM